MMFALIDFRDEPDDKNLLKSLYGIKYVDLATSKQYDPVRELVKYLKVVYKAYCIAFYYNSSFIERF